MGLSDLTFPAGPAATSLVTQLPPGLLYTKATVVASVARATGPAAAAPLACLPSAKQPIQITGDPERDGWFLLGSSDQLGLWCRYSTQERYNVYATSFYIDTSTAVYGATAGNDAASFRAGSFVAGGTPGGLLVVGIGFKVAAGFASSNADTYTKIDPTGQGTTRPATTVGGTDGKCSGECALHVHRVWT